MWGEQHFRFQTHYSDQEEVVGAVSCERAEELGLCREPGVEAGYFACRGLEEPGS